MTIAPNCQIFLPTALQLVQFGAVPVLLAIKDKIPVFTRWQQWAFAGEAVITEAILRHWQEGYPWANIGMGLGHGWACVDLDDLATIEAIALGILPPTMAVKRGARGYTLIYRDDPADPIRRTRTFIHPVTQTMMLEVLSRGRQTVLPPSIHPSGMTYEWIPGPWGKPGDQIIGLPLAGAGMIGQRHIEALEGALSAAGLTKLRRQRSSGVVDIGDRRARYDAWLRPKLADKIAAVNSAASGGRQQALNDGVLPLACFIRVGLLDENWLRDQMEAACEANGYMVAHGFARFSRDFDKAVTDGWDMDLPSLDHELGQVDEKAVAMMGPAPSLPEGLSHLPTVVEDMPLPWRNVRERLSLPKPDRKWLVKNWIPANQVTGFYGGGAGGKTTVLMQLAFAASSGGMWMGMSVALCRVLFISGEDEADELDHRSHDVAVACPPGEHMHIMSLDEDESDAPPFLVVEGPGGVLQLTSVFKRMEAHIREHAITLLILDPIVNLFGGNMNDNRQVTEFITLLRKRICRRLGCTVMFAMHPSGEGLRTGAGEGGAKSWSNSARARLFMEDHPDDAECRIISLKKSNRSSKAGAQIVVKWVKGIFLHGAQAVKQSLDEGICREIMQAIAAKNCLYKWNPCVNYWVGDVMGRVLSKDFNTPGGKREVKAFLEAWEKAGLIRRHEALDENRKKREFVEVLQP